LAREPARDDLRTGELAADLGDVVEHGNSRPVLGQHRTAVRLRLGEANGDGSQPAL
jgi:hypothetical protein